MTPERRRNAKRRGILPQRGPLRSIEQHGEPLRAHLHAERPLTVVTWNTGKGSGPAFDAALARLQSDEGPRRSAELLLLQEARLDHLPVVRGVANFAHSWRGRRGDPNGVLTVAPVAPISPPHSLPSPRRELAFANHKNCLITKYPIDDGRVLAVVNVHGLNFRATPGPLRDQLDALASALDDHDGPLLVGGDFNTWQRGRMHALLWFVRGLGLRRVRPLAGEGTTAREWYKRAIGRPFSLQPDLHLDHMFLRGLIPESGPGHPHWCPELGVSDHVPLYARLRFEAADELP